MGFSAYSTSWGPKTLTESTCIYSAKLCTIGRVIFAIDADIRRWLFSLRNCKDLSYIIELSGSQ
jgi:hypothetical protein